MREVVGGGRGWWRSLNDADRLAIYVTVATLLTLVALVAATFLNSDPSIP